MNGASVSLKTLRLKTGEPGKVPLLHPATGAPLKAKDGSQAYIAILSRDSGEWQRRERDVSERRARRGADGLRYTLEEAAADLTETLALMTRGWVLVDLFGDPLDLPFSFEAALAVYSDDGLAWIRDQVASGSANRALFMPGRSAD